MTKLTGTEETTVLVPYGEKWRLQRRIFHQEFSATSSNKLMDLQLSHVRSMLRLFLDSPSEFEDHIKHFTAGIILKSVYGIQIQPRNDPYVRTVVTILQGVELLVSGVYLVDFIPILKYVPDWLPGASFKRKTTFFRRHLDDILNSPFQEVEGHIAGGRENKSVTANWIRKIAGVSDEVKATKFTEGVKQMAASALLAGYETTSTAVTVLIYLMATHPEVQRKAQQELDAVVGQERLPEFSDREKLPYIQAIIKETLRWFPIVPLGILHKVTSEDEYKGMRIPKGSAVFPNIWAMSRDTEVYGFDSDEFRPERFIENELRDPSKFIFGFGRRICPGRFAAENSLFIAISSIIHAFNITKAIDGNGREIPIEFRKISGLTVNIAPFKCSIVPRFTDVERLIRSSPSA